MNDRIKRFKDNGYKTFHLFGKFYLVRRYSVNFKRFSLYDIIKIVD